MRNAECGNESLSLVTSAATEGLVFRGLSADPAVLSSSLHLCFGPFLQSSPSNEEK